MKVHARDLLDSDCQAMKELLFREGANEWNYITDESINSQLDLIKRGGAVAVLAEADEIAGFAVLIYRHSCPESLKEYADLSRIAYINDVVVSKIHSGKGLGCRLLHEAVRLANLCGCNQVFIERHEENLASAGMMRKAGFEIIDTFYDPQKRFSGTRNTTIERKGA